MGTGLLEQFVLFRPRSAANRGLMGSCVWVVIVLVAGNPHNSSPA